MTRVNYKNIKQGVKEILRRHDPLGLLQHFSDDRFRGELYSYEATTMLERRHSEMDDIEEFLFAEAKNQNLDAIASSIHEASVECAGFLKTH